MTTFVRFRDGSSASWGVIEQGLVRRVVGSIYDEWSAGPPVGRADELKLLPACEPATVVALAYNYKDLVGPRDLYEEPLIFLKPSSSVIGPKDPICCPDEVDKVWVEVEVAFVVRRLARFVPASEAPACILGYTVANDVTARNIHGRDHHLARSKALDTFCPVGHFLHTDVDTRNLKLCTRINGHVTQCGTTANRILDDAAALTLITRFCTLRPGDLVLTGTPAGALSSLVSPGDRVELDVEGLGSLTNPIRRTERSACQEAG